LDEIKPEHDGNIVLEATNRATNNDNHFTTVSADA
jgi:hypothetical protein